MHQRSFDIFAVVALTLCAVTLALVVPGNNLVSHIWALPLVLLFPGYALTCALFAEETFGVAERLIFSLGLSLVIVILGGLVLNWTPFGLGIGTWAVFLGGITVGGGTMALLRRCKQTGQASVWWGIERIGCAFRQGLLVSLAALIVCGAVAVSLVGAERQPNPGFTELWLLPAKEASSGQGQRIGTSPIPTSGVHLGVKKQVVTPTSGVHLGVKMQAAAPTSEVRLGVKNMESMAMEYRLVVYMNDTVVKEWPAINLKQNDTWQTTLVLPQTSQTSLTRVKAMLYQRSATSKVYRDATLWLGIGGKVG